MTDREATTTPCSGPHSDTLPSLRMPRPAPLPTILPPPPLHGYNTQTLERIAWRLHLLNFAVWAIAGMLLATRCGH